ncbi:MAG: hypothetical protein K1X78_21120 [Verrucomicrobiaceae bacterium]|nr:hypothetical protein [Verrucomicrobiaceae bacterium]
MPLTYPRRILALFSVAAGLVFGCVVPLAPFASRTGPLPEKGTAASKADSRAEAARAADRPLAASAGAAAGSPVASAPAAGSADELEARFLADWEAARKSGDKDIDREVQALMKLAAVDPCRAVSLAMKLDGPNATTLLVRLLESMKKTSHHALRALLENPRWQGEWQVVDTIFTNLAEVDPRMAWEEATKDGRTFANHVVFGIGQEWVKDAVVQAKAGPPRTNRLAGVTWSGQGDEIETMHGSSGESSTSAKINGRTVRYFY